MANTVQLKRSSVPGKTPDAANVAVGEPVVNLADKVLYTKDGSGSIITIGAGTTTNISEGTNLYFTNARSIAALTAGENIDIAANGRISAASFGSGTVFANVVIGDLQAKEFTANGSGATFDIDFVPGDANSIIVFVDGVLQAPVVNYSVDNDILTFTSTPAANAVVSVRYFDSGNVYETRYFIGAQNNQTLTANGSGNTFVLSTPLLNSDEAIVFVNGVIQEPGVNYTVSNNILTFSTAPDANAKIFVRTFDRGNEVDLGNLSVNLNAAPQVGQALIWNGTSYEPGDYTVVSNVLSVNGFVGAVSLSIEDLGNVSSNVAIAGQALLWDANINAWAPGNVQLAAGFFDTVSNTAPIGATEAGTTLSITHLDSGVSAGTYGNATSIPQFVVDATGHIVSASNIAISASSGGGNITISSTPPGSPSPGDKWIDENDGTEYIYVSDGTSSQWVDFNGGGLKIVDDVSSVDTYYPILSFNTSGVLGETRVSSTKLYYTPLTGTLNATNFNSLSDARYKENISTITTANDLLNQINPVSFTWKDTGNKSYGVIAQELEKIMPELVNTNEFGMKSVSYTPLISLLISVVQQQQKEIDLLKEKINGN